MKIIAPAFVFLAGALGALFVAPDAEEEQARVSCFIGHVVAAPMVDVDSLRSMPMMLLYVHRPVEYGLFVPAPPDVLVCGTTPEKRETP